MESALIKIKAFIQTYRTLLDSRIPESQVDEIKDFIKESFATLDWETEQVNSGLAEDLRPAYIADTQYQLTVLADKLVSDDSELIMPEESSPIRIWIVEMLINFLDELHTSYRTWFNIDGRLPKTYLLEKSNSALSHEVPQSAVKDKNVDPDLLILLETYADALQGKGKTRVLTWRQYDFIADLFRVIHGTGGLFKEDNATISLMKLLIQQDFNSIHTYAYFMNYVGKISMRESTFTEQQEELLYLQKVFSQVRAASGGVYDPGVQTLKESVNDCILAELSYIAQKEKLYRESFTPGNGNKVSRFYFEIMLTLAELMFLIRIMMETEMLKTKFKAHIYEFVSGHIRTQRAETPSVKSMRNNFSNKPFPGRIVQKVRAWLVKMIEHIDQHYKD